MAQAKVHVPFVVVAAFESASCAMATVWYLCEFSMR